MRFLSPIPFLTLLLAASACAGDAFRIIPRAEWSALEARPYEAQEPVRFTVHHTAVVFDESRDAAEHIRNIQSWGMGEAREWADIPYHFLVSPKGEIFAGRDPFVRGESATPYDTDGHLQVNCLGNFEEQEPTGAQLEALVKLLAWASREFAISPSTLSAHRDHAETLCPGANLYAPIESGEIRDRVNELLDSDEVPTKTKKNDPEF